MVGKYDFIPGTTAEDGKSEHVHARQYEYYVPELTEEEKAAKKKAEEEKAEAVKKAEEEAKELVKPVFDCNKCDFSTKNEEEIKSHVETHKEVKKKRTRKKKVVDESSGNG